MKIKLKKSLLRCQECYDHVTTDWYEKEYKRQGNGETIYMSLAFCNEQCCNEYEDMYYRLEGTHLITAKE